MAIGFDKKAAASRGEPKKVDDLTVEDEREPARKAFPKTYAIIAAVGILVVIIAICILFGMQKGSSSGDVAKDADTSQEDSDVSQESAEGGAEDGAEDEQSEANEVYDEDGNTKDPEGINPGIPDYGTSMNNATTATVFSKDDFISDLNGLDIAAIYNVESREYVEDYVSYEARRAIMADGMEMYWLEAEYNGKPYRVQVPFFYFKDLGKAGICKVEVEVLNLVGGGKVVSYMQVIPNDGDEE